VSPHRAPPLSRPILSRLTRGRLTLPRPMIHLPTPGRLGLSQLTHSRLTHSRLTHSRLARRRPVLRRLILALAACAAALPLILATTPASASVNYVALGDSYSSGLGAGNYISSSGSCYRSYNAYSELWDAAYAPSSFSFVACSGAKTTDVISSQLSYLNSSTTLISMTIGGNDVGFSSTMETCVLGTTSDCVNAIDQAESEMQTQLPGELDTLYSDIRSHAPYAHVVILDYPELYDLSKSSTCIGLSTTDRTDLNQAADELDATIQTEVAKYSGFTYADVRSAFYGHEICDSSSWLHSVNWLFLEESYHPTANGQAYAYYPVLRNNA
jgi:lysophospholipase L1-like esterase